MPSVRVYVRPDVARGLDTETSLKLLRELRMRVAEVLHHEHRMVEAFMIKVDHCIDLPPLSVEIMYSVRPGLQPDEDARERLANDVVAMVTNFDWLPVTVDSVAVWVLPQHEAKFVLEKRIVTTQ